MSALSKVIKSAIVEHQHHYDMVSIPVPTSYCYCGKETIIELPEDRMKWKSSIIESAKLEAHAKHQAEIILEKISE